MAKAIDASKDQNPQRGRLGLYDAAARKIVATRYILAWIVKSCVREAAAVSVKEIAVKCIPEDISISRIPVHRNDAEAEDPGTAAMLPTEDTSITEGTVRYDIRFNLHLPGGDVPVTILVNVELQNYVHLSYPLAARAVSYAARLLGQQGPSYNDLHKVYSIWIISIPKKKDENTVVTYRMAKTITNLAETTAGSTERSIGEEADLMEVVLLNLGEPDAVADPECPSLLRLLDVLFTKSLETAEKKEILEKEFGIPMTKTMEEDLETMQAVRYGFEVDAEARGRAAGMNELLYRQVMDGVISLVQAAQYAHTSEEEFEKAMLAFRNGQTAI